MQWVALKMCPRNVGAQDHRNVPCPTPMSPVPSFPSIPADKLIPVSRVSQSPVSACLSQAAARSAIARE